MTEIFDGLAVVDDPIQEEDRVIHLLASLPDSYDMLVTAVEANVNMPKMEVVTGRYYTRNKNKRNSETSDESKAMIVKQQWRGKFGSKCYYCGTFGHIKRNCRELNTQKHDVADEKEFKENFDNKHKAYNMVEMKREDSSSVPLHLVAMKE